MTFILITAGIIAGLVNYFYVYLNLPIERKKPDASLLDDNKVEWELPRLTYWLALLGYFVIGLAGAFLTPLINSLLALKGLPASLILKDLVDNDKWVLFGYGIVFGFSTNRLLSSIAENILARINAIIKAREPEQETQAFTNKGNDLVADRARLTLDQVRTLVLQNNNSQFSPELVISICWAESSFDPSATATGSSSKGLMMVNNQAVDTVNANTPSGVHFEYSDMLSAVKSISCGTWYLKILFTKSDWGSQGDKRETLRVYRGVNDHTYADKLITCESCMQSTVIVNQQTCLNQIHP